MSAPALDESLLDQAIDWLLRTRDDPGAETQAACRAWRAAHPDHERAWQAVASVGARLRGDTAALPPRVAVRALQRADPGRGRRRALKLMASAALLSGGAVLLRQAPLRAWQAEYRTAVGAWQTVTLPDGSRVHLNTDSAIDTRFRPDQRGVVLLAGEILVETAHDPQNRPMRIETPAGVLQPLGTRFVVRLLPGDDGVRLSVLEGRVQVSDAPALDRTYVVEADEQFEFGGLAAHRIQPLAGEPAAWKQGMMAANRMRLDDFLGELARYRPGVIQCDPAVAHLTVTGAFPVDDTDRVLHSLADLLPLRIRTRTRFWVRVEAKL